MNLYLLRHAIAKDRSEWKGSDAERPLTGKGRRHMKDIAAGLRDAELTFDWILTSPYRRAYDTADILARAFKARKKMKIARSLAPEGDPKSLVRHLALDFRAWESVVLVGHEPYLSRLAGVLLGAPEASMNLRKGGLIHLSAPSLAYDLCASLEGFYPPRLLRRLDD